ncbi:hypothetical protein DSO57_1023743 [Entomophthora muscae]|uniref:Uncharacterized protein n=1 Tax=Entomophthora muscae TaxID=34485 RepID=A0ACC2S4L7_9FUNG|nr:hypothetical protein DSO57_1023743 [Entomophthora muscae]
MKTGILEGHQIGQWLDVNINAPVVHCGCGCPCGSKNRVSATQVPTQGGDGRGEFHSDAAVMNDISILILKTQELNPPQDSPGPANLLSHRLKLLNYSVTCQATTEDSLNGCQVAAKQVSLKTHTYAEDVVCLMEVG